MLGTRMVEVPLGGYGVLSSFVALVHARRVVCGGRKASFLFTGSGAAAEGDAGTETSRWNSRQSPKRVSCVTRRVVNIKDW